jgi:hypothetical protein
MLMSSLRTKVPFIKLKNSSNYLLKKTKKVKNFKKKKEKPTYKDIFKSFFFNVKKI